MALFISRLGRGRIARPAGGVAKISLHQIVEDTVSITVHHDEGDLEIDLRTTNTLFLRDSPIAWIRTNINIWTLASDQRQKVVVQQAALDSVAHAPAEPAFVPLERSAKSPDAARFQTDQGAT